MKASIKKISDCKMRMAVEVGADRVETCFQEVIRDFQKSARLPGFREGRAPFDLIEKRFSKEAEEEVVKTLIPEAYRQSVATHRLSPVSLPAVSAVKIERGKPLTFTAEFEKRPEFSLKGYKGIKIRKPAIEVTPEDVEKGLASLADAKAEFLPLRIPRAVEKGDWVTADIEIREGQGYAPGKKGALLYVEQSQADDFCDKVLGAQAGEAREICVGGMPRYKVWIRGIHEKKLPPVDDALAGKFGKTTADELREAVRKDIEAYKKNACRDRMKEELYGKLLNLVSFAVPEGLVEKQKERLLEDAERRSANGAVSAADFENEKEGISKEARRKAEEQVRLYFILRKVAELERISFEPAELERRLSDIAAESKRPLEEARSVFEEDLSEGLREAATVEFLLANAKLEEKES